MDKKIIKYQELKKDLENLIETDLLEYENVKQLSTSLGYLNALLDHKIIDTKNKSIENIEKEIITFKKEYRFL